MTEHLKRRTKVTHALRQLPEKVSRRYTEARAKKFDTLCDNLLYDPRLSRSIIGLTASSERRICEQVQQILNEFVQHEFQQQEYGKYTWGQTGNRYPIPKVTIAGHNNYPDHAIWYKDWTIAVEVKLYNGQSSILQQAIGQAMIYAQRYGFIIIFIVDATPDGRLAQSFSEDAAHKYRNEELLRNKLWKYHNIEIVCRHIW